MPKSYYSFPGDYVFQIGSCFQTALTTLEGLADATVLSGEQGYPMTVDIEARDTNALFTQGAAGVTLSGVNYRLSSGEHKVVRVPDPDHAFFAVQQEGATPSGMFIVCRVDGKY